MAGNGALLAALLLASLPGPAQAGEPGEADVAVSEEALAQLEQEYEAQPRAELLFEMGRMLLALGRPAEARLRLEGFLSQGEGQPAEMIVQAQAMLYQILTSASVHLEKARSLMQGGHYVEAGKALDLYLEEEGGGLSDEGRQEVVALLDDVAAHTGKVMFDCNVAAKIIISGVVVGSCPLEEPVHLDEGEYQVSAVAQGYDMATRTIAIKGGKDKLVKVVLTSLTRDVCEGITCSGHGTCIDLGSVSSCECDAGYSLSASGRECLISLESVRSTRARAIAGVTMTSLGWALGIAGGFLFGAFVIEAAIPLTALSVTMFEVGIPVAIEAFIRGRKLAGDDQGGPRPDSYRAAWIVLLSTATLWIPPSFMGILPAIVIGSVHLVTASIFGLALGGQAIREMKKLEGEVGRSGPTVMPAVSILEGGVSIGAAGSF